MLNGVLRSIAPQTPFPSVEAVSIKIVFRKDGPWGYPKTIYQEILEVELFGVPEKIVKITSPVSGSVGDGPFVAQFNWPLIPDYSEWGWYSLPSWNNSGVLVEGVSSFPKSNLPPGEYAFYYYCEASNGQYYEDWVYPVTRGNPNIRVTSRKRIFSKLPQPYYHWFFKGFAFFCPPRAVSIKPVGVTDPRR